MIVRPRKGTERVYIAGPMTNSRTPGYNVEAFTKAKEILSERYPSEAVISPVDIVVDVVRKLGPDEPERSFPACFALLLARPPWRDAVLREEMAALRRCTKIFLLPGWEESEGARNELAAALACGMEVEQCPSE